jgi:hypothetical protein
MVPTIATEQHSSACHRCREHSSTRHFCRIMLSQRELQRCHDTNSNATAMQVATPQACSIVNCNFCSTVSCNTITVPSYSATTSRYYWPSPRSSRALCSAMTYGVTLHISCHPPLLQCSKLQKHGRRRAAIVTTAFNLCPSDNLLDFHRTSVQHPSNFHPIFIKFSLNYCHVVLRAIVLRVVILSFHPTSIHHCSFASTHCILQTVRCVKIL